MKSSTTARFRKAFQQLPASVQRQSRAAYRLFAQDPHHPSLRFRRVHPTEAIYSARVGLDYRALGTREGDVIIWFWIGSHSDYDSMLSQL